MRRRAFTLTEVAIVILILGIMAASITLSTNTAKQTAENEAKRLAVVLNRLIETADRTHSRFWFIPKDNNIYISRDEVYNFSTDIEQLKFKVSSGCSFSSSLVALGYNTKGSTYNVYIIDTSKKPAVRVEVSSEIKSNSVFTLTVTGAESSTCYVYVFAE